MKTNYSKHLILLLTGIVSATTLTFMADYAYPKIEHNRAIELKKAILTVMPGVESYEILNESKKIYKALDDKDQTVGYAFTTEGSGYQGTIKILVGITPQLDKLTGIIVLENIETPGLGAKISDKEFQDQFRSISLRNPLEYVLNKKPQKENQVQAITGATISSRAVIKIINNGINEIKASNFNGKVNSK